MSILFNEIVFGPIKSRRLGVSLGVNLLPKKAKVCLFDCVYCECGAKEYKDSSEDLKLPTFKEFSDALTAKLKALKEENVIPDVITFAGNGEPTIHPKFDKIIDETIRLRDQYCPSAKISVLSSSSTLTRGKVCESLKKVDNNILKLDAGIDSTMKLINNPSNNRITVNRIIGLLKQFSGEFIMQTMFLRGNINGQCVDNTKEIEIEAWLEAVKETNPKHVMIYSIDRETPVKTIEKIGKEELEKIAERVRAIGFSVSVS